MVEIRMEYQGNLRVQATHGPSGAMVCTDAPVDNQGRGESFSPTDLVATALGSCVLTVMGIYAERHGIDLRGTAIRVGKIMSASPPRRIARLEITLECPSDPGLRHTQALETAAHACPVHQSLNPEIEKPMRFVWGERITEAQ
ncbi:MAG: OsmC family protein [Verrucomicrobia bacterium]|nr:OsmC family protein [Verrucomicrobiota bacterium]